MTPTQQAFTPEVIRKLDVRCETSSMPTNTNIQYLAYETAIRTANEIFAHGWSRDTFDPTLLHEEIFEKDNNRGPKEQMYRCIYGCRVRVHLPNGQHRDGFGTCDAEAKISNKSQAIQMAAKGAESDATKRALETLGPAFGLHLKERRNNRQQRPSRQDSAPSNHSQTASTSTTKPSDNGRNTAPRTTTGTAAATGAPGTTRLVTKPNWPGVSAVIRSRVAQATTNNEIDSVVSDASADLATMEKEAPDVYAALKTYVGQARAFLGPPAVH